jgi:hypothetical protein
MSDDDRGQGLHRLLSATEARLSAVEDLLEDTLEVVTSMDGTVAGIATDIDSIKRHMANIDRNFQTLIGPFMDEIRERNQESDRRIYNIEQRLALATPT